MELNRIENNLLNAKKYRMDELIAYKTSDIIRWLFREYSALVPPGMLVKCF